MPSTTVTVTPEWVRTAVVAAQHIPDPAGPGSYRSAAEVLRGIGLIQLDPLMRVSTAQRLTSLTRLPRSHRAETVDAALWPGSVEAPAAPVSFEAFTKVACVFPLQDWPLLQLRRERVREQVGQTLTPGLREQILEVVASQPRGVQSGTIESAVGTGRTTGWNWSEVKKAAELMVRTGDLVITAREGVARLFDLPERALPAPLREAEHLPPDELRAALARRAASTLAVMTVADFAHHYHLSRADAALGVDLAGLTPVAVEGWKDTAYVLPELLEAEYDDVGIDAVRQARLIGPFDPLLRERGRARRIFGFDYTFEAYVPREKRVYGHYVMGVLSGTELIGRVDLQRSGEVLQVNEVWAEADYAPRSVRARAKAAASTLARQLGVSVQMPE
ncbi:DNA glycosylase AlkZ-like family protein [Nesterenkonia flava]|uniref:Crosslink repair DNA glycosylase YcaQ family protein n=1 Tax=Nesterenkonia flava TaxID=469799 RepID=A0ABU1FUF7_9MICC|nr:crosslink repair DNA glycosylase YcaQ family protein [Nesterenkonia flava]MDR5712289.1 crosslink repair DNA glycosylase YcaQ family protein [Nesterenkonia flava]